MNLLRFSRSEIKAMQLGVGILVASFVLFAYLANTTILPAVKNLKLHYTECTVVHSDLIFIPPDNSCGGKCWSDKLPYICLQVFVEFSLIPLPDDELGKRYNMDSKGYVFDVDVEVTYPANYLNGDIRLPSKPQLIDKQVWDINKLQIPDELMRKHRDPVYRALLHIDNAQSNFQQKCTVKPPCEKDYHILLQKMRTLQKRLGRQGMTLPCLYNLENPKDVLLNRRYDWWSIYHSVFWPMVLMAHGLAIIFLIYCCIGSLKSSSEKKSTGISKSSGSHFSRESGVGKSKSMRQTKLGMNKFAAV